MKRNLFYILTALLGAGCAMQAPVGAQVTLHNVYRAAPQLPRDIRRVAILPLVADEADAAAGSGRENLEPVLATELAKLHSVELVFISAETLKNITGRRAWRADDVLPPDFFERLRRATDCEAVLFARLTTFRPYPPLAVGWDLKLVGCAKKQALWAVDETFDAGDTTVAAAARRFQSGQPWFMPLQDDTENVLLSPRRFGQYAANAVVSTMTGR